MGMMQEFKEFAMRGNVVDLAVGVVIGGAFGKIISSLVEDVIMPPIGALMGGVNFANLKMIIKDGVGEIPAVTLNYGNFVQTCVNFLIVVFAIFMMIKAMNSMKKAEAAAPPAAPPATEVLLGEIRDLLKQR